MRFKLITLCLFVFSVADAQDSTQTDLFDVPIQDLKNITVSSIDFSNRSLNDSHASAYVINSQMIEKLPMFTLADYIELLIPATNIVPQGTYGAGVGTRGYGRGGDVRILTLWDGHSQNRKDSSGNSGVLYSPLLADLRQIEFVLGPGSLKNGTGALNGYMNLIPKSGQDFQGSKVDLDYGSTDDSKRLQIQHGKRFGKNHDFYFYAGMYQADGFRLTNDFGGSISTNVNDRLKFQDREEIITGDYEPSYKITTNWTQNRFNIKAFFEHLEFDPGGVAQDRNLLSQRTSLSVQPKYTFQLPKQSSFELSSAITLIDRSEIQEPLVEDKRINEIGGRESAVELRGSLQTLHFDDHELTLGAQLKWLDTTSEKHFFSADPNTHNIFVDGKWLEYSYYMEDIFNISDKTTFIAGLRYDGAKFNDNFQFNANQNDVLKFKPEDISNISPRLAVTHKINNNYLFRATYQEGFAYPNVSTYSRTFKVNRFLETLGNGLIENQKPERLQNFEVGLRGDLIENELLFDLSFYYNRLKNNSTYVNVRRNPDALPGNVKTEDIPDDIFGILALLDHDIDGYGSELSLNWKPNRQFYGNISYSYAVPDHIDASDNESTGIANQAVSQWSYFPKHQIKSDLNFKYNNWQFSLAGIYQSGLEFDNTFSPTRENAKDYFVRVNAGINYMLNEKTSISFIAKNLFNNKTPRTSFNPKTAWQGALGSDERLFYLGLRYTF